MLIGFQAAADKYNNYDYRRMCELVSLDDTKSLRSSDGLHVSLALLSATITMTGETHPYNAVGMIWVITSTVIR